MPQLTQLIMLLVFIFAAGALDCGKQVTHFLAARQLERVAQAEIVAVRGKHVAIVPHSNFKQSDKEKLIESFLSQVKMSGLILQSVSAEKISNTGVVALNVFMHGSFSQGIDFFSRMEQACISFQPSHFKLIADHTELSFSLELSLYAACETSQIKLFGHDMWSDPFSPSLEYFADDEKAEHDFLRAFSIRQMRFMGYLQLPHDMLAMVMFPDGEVRDVHRGDSLGYEKSVVTEITADHLIARVGSHQEIIK